MDWGSVTVKDLAELVILAGGVLWRFARIEARLDVLETLVKMLVDRSGMTQASGDD